VLEARGAWDRAAASAPGVWGLLAGIADAAEDDGESSPAARAWLRALAARAEGDLARAEALEDEAAAGGLAGPVARARARVHVDQGYRELGERRFEAAASALQQALRIDPNGRDARFGLAGALKLAGRSREAVAELRELVARFPDDPAAHNELAAALAAGGDRTAARRAWRRALEANPFYLEALANAGLVAAAAGDLLEARRLLERLREVTPSGSSAEAQALAEALASAESVRGSARPGG
jgi:tetratricopeptide (TPR) repeat protein